MSIFDIDASKVRFWPKGWSSAVENIEDIFKNETIDAVIIATVNSALGQVMFRSYPKQKIFYAKTAGPEL